MAKKKARNRQTPKRGTPDPPATPSDRIVWYCLHAMVFTVPLAISNLTFLPGVDIPITYDQFDIVKVFTMRALAVIGLGAWGWSRLTKGGTLRRTKVDWLILAFLGWVVLTTIFSIHPPTAVFGKYRRFEGLLSFITYAVIFFLTVQAVDRPQKIRSLARTLVISGSLVSLYGVMQFVGLDPVNWGKLPFEENRGFSTYGNPDLLGGFLMFPLPLSLALAFSEKKETWRVYYWCAFLLAVAAWLTAFVRGAWIGGVVALGILVIVVFRKRISLTKIDWSFIGATGVAAGIIVAWSLRSQHKVLNIWKRIVSIFQFDEGSAKTRFEIWDAAGEAIKDSPIVGHGADTFRLLFPKYKPVEYVADAGYLSVADNVHNYPLQAASALGIPGFLMLYGIFIWSLWLSAREALSRDGGQRLVLAGFWAAVVGYLTHLLFGLSVTGSSFLLWLAIAILLVPTAKAVDIPGTGATWRTLAAVLVGVLVVAASYLNVRYLWADHEHLMARVGDLSRIGHVEHSEASIRLNPFNDMYRAELGLAHQDVLIGHINTMEALRNAGQDTTVERQAALAAFELAEQTMIETIEFVPPEYDNYVFLANLYNLAGVFLDRAYLDDAVEIADRGIEVEPFGPAIRVQKGRALHELGRLDEAAAAFESAAEMDPDYADARALLGEVYIAQGRLEDATRVLEEALAEEPENPLALEAMATVRSMLDSTGDATP